MGSAELHRTWQRSCYGPQSTIPMLRHLSLIGGSNNDNLAEGNATRIVCVFSWESTLFVSDLCSRTSKPKLNGEGSERERIFVKGSTKTSVNLYLLKQWTLLVGTVVKNDTSCNSHKLRHCKNRTKLGSPVGRDEKDDLVVLYIAWEREVKGAWRGGSWHHIRTDHRDASVNLLRLRQLEHSPTGLLPRLQPPLYPPGLLGYQTSVSLSVPCPQRPLSSASSVLTVPPSVLCPHRPPSVPCP